MVIKVWETIENGGKRLILVKESCYFPEFESLILLFNENVTESRISPQMALALLFCPIVL